MPGTVAVFGTGPAGMVAAWAAIRAGYNVQFFSKDSRKSVLNGCQYLHAEIPVPSRFPVSSQRVEYRLIGTPDQYREKVYGPDYEGEVSPQSLSGIHEAWDIRATYNVLWRYIIGDSWLRNIIHARISPEWVLANRVRLSKFDMIISTIPATSLCYGPHTFACNHIKAIGYMALGDNSRAEVICDGTGSNSWYRKARVFGYTTIEWPGGAAVPIGTRAVKVIKPLYTDCDCFPEITRMGRYGAWHKGILVHNVFQQAERLFQK